MKRIFSLVLALTMLLPVAVGMFSMTVSGIGGSITLPDDYFTEIDHNIDLPVDDAQNANPQGFAEAELPTTPGDVPVGEVQGDRDIVIRGCQSTTPSDGRYNVRFISTIKTHQYRKVGFEVSEIGAKKSWTALDNKVYKSLTALNEDGTKDEITLAQLDPTAQFIAAASVVGVPTGETRTFKVRMYVVDPSDVKHFAETYIVSFNENGKCTDFAKMGDETVRPEFTVDLTNPNRLPAIWETDSTAAFEAHDGFIRTYGDGKRLAFLPWPLDNGSSARFLPQAPSNMTGVLIKYRSDVSVATTDKANMCGIHMGFGFGESGPDLESRKHWAAFDIVGGAKWRYAVVDIKDIVADVVGQNPTHFAFKVASGQTIDLAYIMFFDNVQQAKAYAMVSRAENANFLPTFSIDLTSNGNALAAIDPINAAVYYNASGYSALAGVGGYSVTASIKGIGVEQRNSDVILIKYRTTACTHITVTSNSELDNYVTRQALVTDGQWHYAVIDKTGAWYSNQYDELKNIKLFPENGQAIDIAFVNFFDSVDSANAFIKLDVAELYN